MRLGRYVSALALVLVILVSIIPGQASGQNYLSNTFTLSGSSIVSCWYWGVKFNATGREQFHLRWTSTSQFPTALDLYIASPSAIGGIWYCDYGPEALYDNSGAFGSVSWIAPATGEYVVLVVNNNRNSVSGALSILAANATVAVTAIGYATARQQPICSLECPSQLAN